jgi:hypothetical protein
MLMFLSVQVVVPKPAGHWCVGMLRQFQRWAVASTGR